MKRARSDATYTDQEQRMLAARLRPAALDEARIQQTLTRARSQHRRRQVRKRILAVACATVCLGLVAAGAWRWSGRDSDRGLDLARAIQVTQEPGNYELENIRAAVGRINRDINRALDGLLARDALPPAAAQELLAALDRPGIATPDDPGDLARLQRRIDSGQPLSAAELRQVVAAVKAGIAAIRYTGHYDERHAVYSDILCDRLRTKLDSRRGGR